MGSALGEVRAKIITKFFLPDLVLDSRKEKPTSLYTVLGSLPGLGTYNNLEFFQEEEEIIYSLDKITEITSLDERTVRMFLV